MLKVSKDPHKSTLDILWAKWIARKAHTGCEKQKKIEGVKIEAPNITHRKAI